jgi:hypothetical protein
MLYFDQPVTLLRLSNEYVAYVFMLMKQDKCLKQD